MDIHIKFIFTGYKISGHVPVQVKNLIFIFSLQIVIINFKQITNKTLVKILLGSQWGIRLGLTGMFSDGH
jgi:hypothetical protein